MKRSDQGHLAGARNAMTGRCGARRRWQRGFATALSLAAALTISQTALAGTPAADANVKLVKSFLVDVRAATFQHHDPKEIRAVSERYIGADYVQHSAGMEPGRDGYIDSMVKLAQGPGPGGAAMPPIEDLYWIADGDKVVWVSRIQLPGQDKPEFMFNMMRVQNGKIVEHWGK